MNLNFLQLTVLILINTFGVFLLILISANSIKDKEHIWFILMTIFLLGWVNFAYLGDLGNDVHQALILYRINSSFVAAFFYAAYLFYIVYFLKVRKIFYHLLILLASLAFIFFSLFSNGLIQGVIGQSWGNEIVFGPLDTWFNLFSVIMASTFIYYFFSRYGKLPAKEKTKVIYFLIGTFVLIFFNLIFNVLSPVIIGSSKYQHLGDYSAVLFLAFTAYAILRHNFLGAKVATAAFLISFLSTLLLVDILVLSNSLLEKEAKTFIFAFFIIISVLLVRSVLNEIHQKEELEKANLALEKSQHRYMDLASEQKDIIDVMGHEIRTPLTTIIQEIKIHQKYTLPIEDTLLREAENQPNLHKLLPFLLDTIKITDGASTHALGIVTDMLETARLDKKRFELDLEQFDLIPVVQEAISLTEKGESKDNPHSDISLELSTDLKENALTVVADKNRIKEALLALLSNAIKYQDPQKEMLKIKVKLELQKKDQVKPMIILTVQDNGIGLNQEDIPKLGRKFFRVSSQKKSRLPRPGGTGLGLFVVQGIMEHHHGHLEILSPGKGLGSSFSLVFPQNQAEIGSHS